MAVNHCQRTDSGISLVLAASARRAQLEPSLAASKRTGIMCSFSVDRALRGEDVCGLTAAAGGAAGGAFDTGKASSSASASCKPSSSGAVHHTTAESSAQHT